jgi:predicted metal-dependent hydrolase
MIFEYQLQDKKIEVRARLADSFGISLRKDHINVRVPAPISERKVTNYLKKYQQSIEKYYQDLLVRKSRFALNNHILLWGKDYIIKHTFAKPFIYNENIHLNPLKEKESYFILAKETALISLKPFINKYKLLFGVTPTIIIKNVISKYGSCNSKKNIMTFSTILALIPLNLIEYVVAHEFNHYKVKKHDKIFFNELEKVLPNAYNLDRELNKYERDIQRKYQD